MDKTLISDVPSDDRAIVLAIEDASAEIGQAIEQMRKDQAEIEQLKGRDACDAQGADGGLSYAQATLRSVKKLLLVAHEAQENKAEMKELRRELKDLTALVQRLAYEIHRVGENEAHERENLALRLENELLKFEHRLPSGGSKNKQ